MSVLHQSGYVKLKPHTAIGAVLLSLTIFIFFKPAPPECFAAEATVTATGRVVYTDNQRQVVPVKHAKVTMYDYDYQENVLCMVPGVPLELCRTEMGSAFTNDDGEFEIDGSATDNDLCIPGAKVIGNQCCDGAYIESCDETIFTAWGNNQCCPNAAYQRCDPPDIYIEGYGCCDGLYNPVTGDCEDGCIPLTDICVGSGNWYPSDPTCVAPPELILQLPICLGTWVELDYPDPYIQVEAVSEAGAV